MRIFISYWLQFTTVLAVSVLQHAAQPPQMFVVEQQQQNSIENVLNAQNPRLNNIALASGIGQPCVNNFTCSNLPNTYCTEKNNTCKCIQNFMEDKTFRGSCRLAPGYNEVCASGELQCRQPFICNKTDFCDCPVGFIQEYFQCIKDCPTGQIPIGDDCYSARFLNEKCTRSEQCVQTYSQCLRSKCQCMQGAKQVNGSCIPTVQCPVGSPLKDKKSNSVLCDKNNLPENETCPIDHYCMYADNGLLTGVCCPKIKISCPIGQALDDHDCTNCPWETHHCFSYTIGAFAQTMCCPNACPTSHPIQKGGKCYARTAFGGHCDVDDQCYNVAAAVCRKDTVSNSTTCQCPLGNFKYYFGRCLQDSALGEKCTRNDECKPGSNTHCVDGVCACFETFIPEPAKSLSSKTPRNCIAEPSCPTVHGLKPVQDYVDCSEDPEVCKIDQFCRQWWFSSNYTYSLCCQKPTLDNYRDLCKPFSMKASMEPNGKTVRSCDTLPVPQSVLNDGLYGNETNEPKQCPTGASCLFDPFSVNKGVCCEPDLPLPVVSVEELPTAVPPIQPIEATVPMATEPTTRIPTKNNNNNTRTHVKPPKPNLTGNIPVIRIRSKKD